MVGLPPSAAAYGWDGRPCGSGCSCSDGGGGCCCCCCSCCGGCGCCCGAGCSCGCGCGGGGCRCWSRTKASGWVARASSDLPRGEEGECALMGVVDVVVVVVVVAVAVPDPAESSSACFERLLCLENKGILCTMLARSARSVEETAAKCSQPGRLAGSEHCLLSKHNAERDGNGEQLYTSGRAKGQEGRGDGTERARTERFVPGHIGAAAGWGG